MPLFTPRCPVSPEAEKWIETSMDWLISEFGPAAMAVGPLWVSDAFSGWTYSGTRHDVQRLLEFVCVRMQAPAELIDLEIIEDDSDSDLGRYVALGSRYEGEAGHYVKVGDRHQIAVTRRQTMDPVSVVATLAHEVGHMRLLGEGRITTANKDHEQLTDLTTVFFGFGIFSANASYDFTRNDQGGWRASRLGYLGERLLGYGLAYWAMKRGELRPTWAADLDDNPRLYMRKGLRYLRSRSA